MTITVIRRISQTIVVSHCRLTKYNFQIIWSVTIYLTKCADIQLCEFLIFSIWILSDKGMGMLWRPCAADVIDIFSIVCSVAPPYWLLLSCWMSMLLLSLWINGPLSGLFSLLTGPNACACFLCVVIVLYVVYHPLVDVSYMRGVQKVQQHPILP